MNTPHLSSTVFIVDDDEAVRDSLRWLLEANGYRVRAYASGESFLEDYDASQVGVLIADVRMPGMSGLELQQRLLAENRCVPIVFITAHDDEQARQTAMLGGAVGFLHKPFEDHVLLESLSRTATQHPAHEKSSAPHDVGKRPVSNGSLPKDS